MKKAGPKTFVFWRGRHGVRRREKKERVFSKCGEPPSKRDKERVPFLYVSEQSASHTNRSRVRYGAVLYFADVVVELKKTHLTRENESAFRYESIRRFVKKKTSRSPLSLLSLNLLELNLPPPPSP